MNNETEREEFRRWMVDNGLYGWPRKPYDVQSLVEAAYEMGKESRSQHDDAASSAPPSVSEGWIPKGWALVPIKATKEMKAVCRIAGKTQVWDDMMAARPAHPHQEDSCTNCPYKPADRMYGDE